MFRDRDQDFAAQDQDAKTESRDQELSFKNYIDYKFWFYTLFYFCHLYADDLIFMAESKESLHDKIVKWRSGLEAEGLGMSAGEAKVVFSCGVRDGVEERGEWLCGVCGRGVGRDSILCHGCRGWIHGRCG